MPQAMSESRVFSMSLAEEAESENGCRIRGGSSHVAVLKSVADSGGCAIASDRLIGQVRRHVSYFRWVSRTRTSTVSFWRRTFTTTSSPGFLLRSA